jgi:hypothetical protein
MHVSDDETAGYLFHVTGHVTGNIRIICEGNFVKYQILCAIRNLWLLTRTYVLYRMKLNH